jgi:hypothetical protein
MIPVIPVSPHHPHVSFMTMTDALSASTVTGTGEFSRKGQHVMAAVEIRNGAIQSVSFSSEDGRVPDGAEAVIRILIGRTVVEALEVKPLSLAPLAPETYEVLLEAFYRAVETCLDPQ